jgi:uncharacterized protein
MNPSAEIKRLRIYISSTDIFRHAPLYEVIVYAAKRYGLSGATVTKGIMGFGSSSVVHSIKLWEVSDKLPLIIEIIDETDKINRFMSIIIPWLEKVRYGSIVTVEKVEIAFLKAGIKKA